MFAMSMAWHDKFLLGQGRVQKLGRDVVSFYLLQRLSYTQNYIPKMCWCQVTAVSWSETYSDLFVVAFGSFDFQKQAAGLVAGFSLKNPAHPEFAFMLKSGQ